MSERSDESESEPEVIVETGEWTEVEVEEFLSSLHRMDTVECGGYCGDRVMTDSTVDVTVGAIVGCWSRPVKHVGVTGLESRQPTVQQWCVPCAKSQFGVKRSAAEQRRETATRYLTGRTAMAFTSGLLLALLLSAMFMI